MPENPPIIVGTRIGHVHLKVARYYDRAATGLLLRRARSFELQQRLGSGAAFISAGGYHHHIGLNTWESKGGCPPCRRAPPGCLDTAILYPTRPALARTRSTACSAPASNSTARQRSRR